MVARWKKANLYVESNMFRGANEDVSFLDMSETHSIHGMSGAVRFVDHMENRAAKQMASARPLKCRRTACLGTAAC